MQYVNVMVPSTIVVVIFIGSLVYKHYTLVILCALAEGVLLQALWACSNTPLVWTTFPMSTVTVLSRVWPARAWDGCTWIQGDGVMHHHARMLRA